MVRKGRQDFTASTKPSKLLISHDINAEMPAEPLTKEEKRQIDEIWRKGLFVFDTNVLLDLFRLPPDGQASLLSAFEQLKDRLWMPNQIRKEFSKDISALIAKQKLLSEELTKSLDKATPNLSKFKKHLWIDVSAIIREYEEAKKKALQLVKANRKKVIGKEKPNDYYERLCIELSEKLDLIFSGKEGKAYSIDQYLQKIQLAKLRFEEKIPPGFEDSNTKTENVYGDAIIWYQMLEYAKATQCPMFFITEDRKPDWMERNKPHPSLRAEFLETTGQPFWSYNFENFHKEGVSRGLLKANETLTSEMRELNAITFDFENEFNKYENLIQDNESLLAEIERHLTFQCILLSDINAAPSTIPNTTREKVDFLYRKGLLTAVEAVALTTRMNQGQEAVLQRSSPTVLAHINAMLTLQLGLLSKKTANLPGGEMFTIF